MASAATRSAINAAIEAAWTHTTIRYGTGPADVPADNSPYLVVTYPFARERQMSIGAPGANRWRTEGGFLVELCIPTDEQLTDPETPWLARLDTLRAALRGNTFGGVETFAASPAIEDESSDREAYYVTSFTVEYQADVIG